MKKIILIILAVALVGGIGYKIKEKMDKEAALKTETAQQQNRSGGNTPVVTVVQLVLQPIKETLNVVGEIKADNEVSVQPMISGRLVSLLVDEGQPVRRNQLVAVLDDETIRLQVQQSEATMVAIQANLSQADLDVAKNKAEKERYQELLSKKYISQREFDNADNAYLVSLAKRDAIRAQLAEANRKYDVLKVQLNQTKVYSPINGYVIKKMVTEGMNLTTGSTIVMLAGISPVKLVFNIDQKETAKIHRGMRVVFTTDAFPGDKFAGAVNDVAPTYDPKTRTLSLSVSLPNREGRLIPGIFGSIEILVGGKDQALVVPQESIVLRENRTGVYVVDDSKVARFVPISTGLSAEGRVEVLSGLKLGDQVVVVGQTRLRDGQQVQVMKMNGNGKSDKNANSSGGDGDAAKNGNRTKNRKVGGDR